MSEEVIHVTEGQYRAFKEILDRPVKFNAALTELLSSKSNKEREDED